MSYTVYYSEEAERDLHSIFQYIAFNLSAPIAARRQTDEIMKEIEALMKTRSDIRYISMSRGTVWD